MNNYKAVPSFISPSVCGDFLEVSANVHSNSLLNTHWFGLKVSHASFRSNFFSQHLLQHRRKPLVHSSDLKDHRLLKLPSQSERSGAACLTLPRVGQFNMRCPAREQNSFSFTLNPHGCPRVHPQPSTCWWREIVSRYVCWPRWLWLKLHNTCPAIKRLLVCYPLPQQSTHQDVAVWHVSEFSGLKWKRRHYSAAWFEWLNWQEGNY